MARFTIDATGAQSIGSGVGNLFKALAMGPHLRAQAERQNALQDSQMYAHTMQGNKSGAQAEDIADLMTSRKGEIARLDSTPDLPPYQRYALSALKLAGAGHVDDYMKGANAGLKTQSAEAVLADPSQALPVAQAFAATSGKMPFGNAKADGYSLNGLTGENIVANPVIAKIYQAVENSKAHAQNAAATNAYASAGQHRAQTDKIRGDIAGKKTGDRPLPTAALKMQEDELDAIGLNGAINADLGAILKQLDSGQLTLGPYANMSSRFHNMIGSSDEQSRNFQSFQSTLEKMRNDSLRLNKGTQTEGDAERAWGELLRNTSDTGLVTQRLHEIQNINQRAAQLKQMKIDTIRENFGAAPLDAAAHFNVEPALGADRTIVKRGALNGRPVVQYSDGSVGFAQ